MRSHRAKSFFSCLVEKDTHLWTVVRYIEKNPLKVNLAERAENYRWSSAKAHINGTDDEVLEKPSWLPLDARKDYAEFMLQDGKQGESLLRKATRTGRPFGSEGFIQKMELQLNQALMPRKPGRPRRKTGECP